MADAHFSVMLYILDMSDMHRRTAKSIRINEEVYYRARVAAVISRKSLGQWLEEAVEEKLSREGVPPFLASKGQG